MTEVALASVRNYVVAVQSWFGVSFSDLNIASIPMSFDLDRDEIHAVAKKPAVPVSLFLAHIKALEEREKAESPFAVSVQVNFDLLKKKNDDAVKVNLDNETPDLSIRTDLDSVPPGYTWTYEELGKRLKARYMNFKQDPRYNKARKILEADGKLCFIRFLDPSNKKSSSKKFYNPNILKHFDENYDLKLIPEAVAAIKENAAE